MATFHVDSYLDNISAKIERKTISTLVEHSLQSQSLNAEHKTSLEDSGKLRKLQKRDQLEDFKQNVQKLWTDFRDPRQSVALAVSNFNTHRTNIMRDHVEKENFEIAAGMRENKYIPPRPLPVFPECKPYVHLGDRFYAVCPDTGIVSKEVLENPMEYTLQDVLHLIHFTPHSKSLHILESVKRILDFSSSVGLTRKTVSLILKDMVKKFNPSKYGIFNLIEDPDEIFKNVISLVSYDGLLDNIKNGIKRIIRNVGDGIDEPINVYKSLLLEGSQTENPNLDKYIAVTRAEKACINSMKFLMSKNMAELFEKFRINFDYRFERRPDLTECIKFVVDTERQKRFALDSAKSLEGNPISCSLFNTDIMWQGPDNSENYDGHGNYDQEHERSFGGNQIQDKQNNSHFHSDISYQRRQARQSHHILHPQGRSLHPYHSHGHLEPDTENIDEEHDDHEQEDDQDYQGYDDGHHEASHTQQQNKAGQSILKHSSRDQSRHPHGLHHSHSRHQSQSNMYRRRTRAEEIDEYWDNCPNDHQPDGCQQDQDISEDEDGEVRMLIRQNEELIKKNHELIRQIGIRKVERELEKTYITEKE